MELLKPKTKALGFSKQELKSVAEHISDNLDLEDEASEEDVEAAITAQIDAALPLLKLTQSAVSRIVNARAAKADEDDDDDDETTSGKKSHNGSNADGETAELLKALNSLKEEVASLKKERKTTDYKSRVTELLGKKGDKVLQRELKRLSRMSFADEDEFEDYISELEDDIKDIPDIKKSLGDPGTGDDGGKKPEELGDSDIADIAGLIN